MLEAAIFTALTSDAGVAAIVERRVFPDVAPQDAAEPLLVVTVVDDIPEATLSGPASGSLSNARVQVDVYAKTREQASQLKDATLSALGDRPSPSADGLSIVVTSRGRNLFDDETQLYRVLMEFNVWR